MGVISIINKNGNTVITIHIHEGTINVIHFNNGCLYEIANEYTKEIKSKKR